MSPWLLLAWLVCGCAAIIAVGLTFLFVRGVVAAIRPPRERGETILNSHDR